MSDNDNNALYAENDDWIEIIPLLEWEDDNNVERI